MTSDLSSGHVQTSRLGLATRRPAAWLHWRARPLPVIAFVVVLVVAVHGAIAYLQASLFFADFQAAGPVAVGAALAALAIAHVDEPTGMGELHARAAASPWLLYILPRLVVLTVALVGLTTAVRTVPGCGPAMAATNVTVFTGLALLISAGVGRVVGGAVPALWVITLVASSAATGVAADIWRWPLQCDPHPLLSLGGSLTTGVGLLLPPRRGLS